MAYENLLFDVKNQIAYITFNRPNAGRWKNLAMRWHEHGKMLMFAP
jgi:hypothetical protein